MRDFSLRNFAAICCGFCLAIFASLCLAFCLSVLVFFVSYFCFVLFHSVLLLLQFEARRTCILRRSWHLRFNWAWVLCPFFFVCLCVLFVLFVFFVLAFFVLFLFIFLFSLSVCPGFVCLPTQPTTFSWQTPMSTGLKGGNRSLEDYDGSL